MIYMLYNYVIKELPLIGYLHTRYCNYPFRWNFSVGQHDVSFLEAVLEKNGNGNCSVEDDPGSTDWSLRVSIPNGLVAAVSTQGSKETEVVLWSHQFDSPIAAVWRLNEGLAQPVTLLTKDVMPELAHSSTQGAFPQGPVMYIGKKYVFIVTFNLVICCFKNQFLMLPVLDTGTCRLVY